MIKKLENPCISRTFSEKIAKTVLTVILACAYTALLFLTKLRTTDPVCFYLFLTVGFETVIIAVLGKKAPRFSRMYPILQYTLTCFAHLLMLAKNDPPKTLIQYLEAGYGLLVIYMLAKCLIDFFTFLKSEKEIKTNRYLFHHATSLIAVVGLDLVASMFYLMIHPATMELLISVAIRLSFYFSATLLVMPADCILINIKRIIRLALMFLITSIFGVVSVMLMSKLFGVNIPTHYLVIISSIFTAFVLGAKTCATTIFSAFDYRLKDNYSYNIGKEDACAKSKNEYILQMALDRDYSKEYSQCFWNFAHYIDEIADIQSQLQSLKQQYAEIGDNVNDTDREEIRSQMVCLLGSLSDNCDFSNGFSNHRMEYETTKETICLENK